MDGTLGSQTAWMLDGSGVRITSGEELAEIVRAAARAGWPVGVHAIGDRANRRGARCVRGNSGRVGATRLQRIEHAQCLAPEDVPRFAELGVTCSVQFSQRPRTATRGALLARPARGRVCLSLAAGVRRRPLEWLRCADRGARPSGGDSRRGGPHDRRAPGWRLDEALTVEQALHATTVAPAWLAGDERRAGSSSPATSPTWSSSPATRSSVLSTSSTRSRSSRRWWPAAGCTTRRPGLNVERETLDRRDGRSLFGIRCRRYAAARPGHRGASTRSSSSAAACGRAPPCSRSAPARGRRHAAPRARCRPARRGRARSRARRVPGAARRGASGDRGLAARGSGSRPARSTWLPRLRRSTGSTSR